MGFLFDENLSVAVAIWAEATLALDVLGARAEGLSGKSDHEVRWYGLDHERIMVTLDADCGNLVRFSTGGTPGVIWLRPRTSTDANVRALPAKQLPRLSTVDLHGKLAVVEEEKLRVRGTIEL